MILRIFPAFLLLLSLTISTKAQDSLQVLSSTDGAACYSILHYNDYLYTGNGNTFKVYHAVDQPPYEETFSIRLSSNVDDIQRLGNNLYISANHAGLYKWDITDPALPQAVCFYKPQDFDEAAWDISFYGQDTIFLTYKTKVAVFRDLGSSFELVTTFAQQSGSSLIRGGAVKDTIFAYTTGYAGNSDGIYIVDARDFTQIAYYQQTYCDPEDLVFGQNTNLLHVLGGTQSTTNPFNPDGCFYSLDLTDPYNPVEVFYDTLNTIFGMGIAIPREAEIRNDTLFVATNAAMDESYVFPEPMTGHAYIYDASDPDSVKLLNSVYAGLWHFDLALQGNLMHVASEWYGIETVDITDIYNEVPVGKTLTGGWNWGTGVRGDTMIVTNGGYGFKVFDISDPENPELIHINTDTNFCLGAEFSADGNYLYGFYLSNDGLRVFDPNTFTQIGSMPNQVGHQKTYAWQNKIVSMDKPSIGTQKLNVTNISDPVNPVLDSSFAYNANDLFVDENGKMFVTHNDSLIVWDLSNNLERLAYVYEGLFVDFKALAVYEDTVFAFVTNKGLVRYLYDGNNSFIEDTVVSLQYGSPKYMAADASGLYLCYVEYGLFAYDKKTITETGWFEHGLEYIFTAQWGPRDLFCQDGLIFLVEWFGQTTILRNNDGNLNKLNKVTNEIDDVLLYPNPFNESSQLNYYLEYDQQVNLEISDLNGRVLQHIKVSAAQKGNHQLTINKGKLSNGVYLGRMSVNGENKIFKFVISD